MATLVYDHSAMSLHPMELDFTHDHIKITKDPPPVQNNTVTYFH